MSFPRPPLGRASGALALLAAATLTVSALPPPAQTAHAAPASPALGLAKKTAGPTGYAKVDAPEHSFFVSSPETLTARVGSPRARTVHLEAKSASKWRTIATRTSRQDGTVTFPKVSFSRNTTVRINAPAQAFIGQDRVSVVKAAASKAARKQKAAQATVTTLEKRLRKARNKKDRTRITKSIKAARTELKAASSAARAATRKASRKQYVAPWSVSPEVLITVEAQRVSIGAIPPLAQPGKEAAAPTAASDSLVNVRVVPARSGRVITLQARQGTSWRAVASARTDPSGNVVLPATPGTTYRAVVAAGSGGPSATTSAVKAVSYSLDFEDTFSGDTLDPAKWTHQNRPLGTGLRSCASTDDQSSRVGGGVFEMGVSVDPALKDQTCTYVDGKGVRHDLPFMRNTQVSTRGKYDLKHGFMAARVKVQSGEGTHSSFWSQPPVNLQPGNPAAGVEIDVFEYFGDSYFEPGIGTFLHWADSRGTVQKEGDVFALTEAPTLPGAEHLSEQFAVYSVEWTPREYVFRLDGREYFRTSNNVSQVPQNLALSHLSSSWEMLNNTDPTWSGTAKVDWVRTWRR